MRKWFPMLALLALVAGTTKVQATEHQHYGDANLYAIQFVGDGEGWACGDEGVILHTIDGGKNWERVSSGTRGSLNRFAFSPLNLAGSSAVKSFPRAAAPASFCTPWMAG